MTQEKWDQMTPEEHKRWHEKFKIFNFGEGKKKC